MAHLTPLSHYIKSKCAFSVPCNGHLLNHRAHVISEVSTVSQTFKNSLFIQKQHKEQNKPQLYNQPYQNQVSRTAFAHQLELSGKQLPLTIIEPMLE